MQTTEKFGDVAVVSILLDQMDASTADDLKQELAPVLNENNKIVLDLKRVRYLDSRGCGVILSCLKQASRGGDLKLCNVQPNTRTILEMVRIHRS